MANTLINGTGDTSPPSQATAPASGLVPTWIYAEDTGEGIIIDHPAGAPMPDGFVDNPSKAADAALQQTKARQEIPLKPPEPLFEPALKEPSPPADDIQKEVDDADIAQRP
jgi:hypothetical protein